MNEMATTFSHPIALPPPRVPVMTRVATMADVPFLDALQKQHSKALGYFPTKQFEGYIEMGGVLIASLSTEYSVPSTEGKYSVPSTEAKPLGYVISRDRYLKRDELGVIYQLCVVPGDQRKLIGASLIKAVFERSAYGCRLYCCWCAQDLAANYFWESLGFVPIAFRAGGRKTLRRRSGQERVHIFWQRRITDDQTPYWYPFQTNSGAIREDRIVFPIPPGVHWRDVRAVGVPTAGEGQDCGLERAARPALPGTVRPRRAASAASKSAGPRMMGGLYAAPAPAPSAAKKQRAPRTKPAAARIDPAFLVKARELRDRWMERVNDAPGASPAPAARYEVGRPASTAISPSGILPAAA
jgi:hypothetical protein